MFRSVYLLLFIASVAFSLEPVGKAAPSPPTTSAPVTTSTAAPPTTSTPPSTTSAAPSTSTSAPTTLGPSTTTVKPQTDKWVVKDNGTVCMIATMKIKFEIPYNDSKPVAAMGRLEVPESADSSGSSCNASDPTVPQVLLLRWNSPNSTDPAVTNWVKFTFMANSENKTDNMYKHYWLSKIEAMLNVNDSIAFPNMTGNYNMVDAMNDTMRFDAPLGSSYSCGPASMTPLTMKPLMVGNMKGQVVLADVQVEAFRSSADSNFSNAVTCENSDTPDLVPILVGSFLILLVVCVLVAYIITRRRAMARGYLSM